ncbi:hypothetical protein T459_26729 [Capsicum annuum]|uniref:Pentatricopeptide repeat-containing protein, mitochondrial n=1 Tax=Capsicum annuum TaxID=4072 RepID=A0A2G2YBW2_CAPAN|nr:hypothetical protein T459_26729 [Capsicum annuum]
MVWILIDELKAKGLLSKEAFALVSRRYARGRKVKEAIEAFESMEKYGLVCDDQDYNRLLDTLCKSSNVAKAQEVKKYDEAIEMFREMERKKIKATPHVYCTLINGLGSEKRLVEALKYFELYKGSGFELEVFMYNSMVGAYCWSMRMDDAYKLVDEMRRSFVARIDWKMLADTFKKCSIWMRPPVPMFDNLKCTLLDEGKEETVKVLWQKVEKLRKSPSVG